MTDFHVPIAAFRECLKMAPRADINIFGLSPGKTPFEQIREFTDLTKTSCVFVKDSGEESALV
jgi:solute carrier family 12 sodium/potassium/chloride transporter 2